MISPPDPKPENVESAPAPVAAYQVCERHLRLARRPCQPCENVEAEPSHAVDPHARADERRARLLAERDEERRRTLESPLNRLRQVEGLPPTGGPLETDFDARVSNPLPASGTATLKLLVMWRGGSPGTLARFVLSDPVQRHEAGRLLDRGQAEVV